MSTDAQILTLAQWFSPAYPIGAFSYSHGLEWAAPAGDMYDAETLKTWLTDVLEHGAGQADALFLAAAYRAETPAQIAEINTLCTAFAPSKERLLETEAQGAAFSKITADISGQAPQALAYPVAVGHAAKHHDLPQVLTAKMYLHAFAANLVTAAQRLAPIGQTDAQTLIRDLAPLCEAIAQDTAHGDLDQLTSTAFLADIAAMKHETQTSRIFRT